MSKPDAPGNYAIHLHVDHEVRIIALCQVEFHSRRRLYTAICVTCREVLHADTADPLVWVDLHIREAKVRGEFVTATEMMTER
jgi:hypothetical protein